MAGAAFAQGESNASDTLEKIIIDPVNPAISSSGDVVIDTSTLVAGPPIGTNTTGQEAEGPHCTGGGEH